MKEKYYLIIDINGVSQFKLAFTSEEERNENVVKNLHYGFLKIESIIQYDNVTKLIFNGGIKNV